MTPKTPTQEYIPFPKLARLYRPIVIAEKIDGTNASIHVDTAGQVFAGSRTRWITPSDDNFGFAQWVEANADELRGLGPGTHFGEWWGNGIQRTYGVPDKRFSLFNTVRWCAVGDTPQRIYNFDPQAPPKYQDVAPACCRVVPVLYTGLFNDYQISTALKRLNQTGSVAAPGFMRPEGIVVFHMAAQQGFKITLENDNLPKGWGFASGI